MYEGSVMKSNLRNVLLALLLGSTALLAQTPAQLAQNEGKISRQIFQSYLNGSDTQYKLSQLHKIQQKLRSSSGNPEIANMLTYLDLCIVKLQSALHKAPSPATIGKVRDLTRSIEEGSRYIATANERKITEIALR